MSWFAAAILVPFAFVATLAIVSLERGWRRLHFVAKPGTMVLGIASPVTALGAGGGLDRYGLLVLVGLGFSLVGDVLLMLESDYFVYGLASFLVAHGFYIAAFAGEVGARTDPIGLAPLALLAPFSVAMMRALRPGLGRLFVPVAAYIAVIAVMGWFAFAMWFFHPNVRGVLAASGAALFMTSDSVLALDRFRAPMRFAKPVLLATYFAAQWCFAAST